LRYRIVWATVLSEPAIFRECDRESWESQEGFAGNPSIAMESLRAYLECPRCRPHYYLILTVLDQLGFHLCRELARRDLAGQLQHFGLVLSRFPGAKSDLGSLRLMVRRGLLRRRS
jgi:hypothetical protein